MLTAQCLLLTSDAVVGGVVVRRRGGGGGRRRGRTTHVVTPSAPPHAHADAYWPPAPGLGSQQFLQFVHRPRGIVSDCFLSCESPELHGRAGTLSTRLLHCHTVTAHRDDQRLAQRVGRLTVQTPHKLRTQTRLRYPNTYSKSSFNFSNCIGPNRNRKCIIVYTEIIYNNRIVKIRYFAKTAKLDSTRYLTRLEWSKHTCFGSCNIFWRLVLGRC